MSAAQVEKVVDRAAAVFLDWYGNRLDVETFRRRVRMVEGRTDLDAWAAVGNGNVFMHDVTGINRKFDEASGEFTHGFVPRFRSLP